MGSVAKGAALVSTGGAGKTLQCAICHIQSNIIFLKERSMNASIQPHNVRAAATWNSAGRHYDRVSQSIADAIEQRAPEIAEQRALALRLERAEIANRLQHGFLYDVGRVDGVPGPTRDAAVRPAVKRWKVTLKKSIKCPTVTSTGASK